MIFRFVRKPITTDQTATLQTDPDQTRSEEDATSGICRTSSHKTRAGPLAREGNRARTSTRTIAPRSPTHRRDNVNGRCAASSPPGSSSASRQSTASSTISSESAVICYEPIILASSERARSASEIRWRVPAEWPGRIGSTGDNRAVVVKLTMPINALQRALDHTDINAARLVCLFHLESA